MEIRKGPELWKEAKKIIPGGSQLFSKQAELFLPGKWPAYYRKAKGIEVRDLDGNKFLDFSIMGVGSCVLGYADEDVNKAVRKAIDSGSMNTLNCPEEVALAKRLLKMHPWAGMVRFLRCGGEAMAAAVRIARAFSGKDRIAFCGYHGWHDWYLSANLAEKNTLDGHLLPGLKPSGVPRVLRNTALPFTYNRIEELKELAAHNEIGAIVMEPMRSQYPEKNFLQEVRDIASEIKAVLVFDEITSGFRMTLGGIHQLFKVLPDMAVYGKALSNGYPMAAIVGRKKIMQAAGESFISSTYWTERIGPAAALATLKKMKEKNVPSHLIRTGRMISKGWTRIAEKHGLKIRITGIPPLTTLQFDYGKHSQALLTLFTQEMLKRGFLAGKTVYVSYAHRAPDVSKYLENVDNVFKIIKEAIDRKRIYKLLEGPVAQTGFGRLT